jgi:hypothetical protein
MSVVAESMDTNGSEQVKAQDLQSGLVQVPNQSQKRKLRGQGEVGKTGNQSKKTHVNEENRTANELSGEDLALAEKEVSEFLALHKEMKKSLDKVHQKLDKQNQTIAEQKMVLQTQANLILALQEEVKALKDERAAAQINAETNKTIASTPWSSALFKSTTKLTTNQKVMQAEQIKVANTLSAEFNERERRKKNVVIFGLNESKKEMLEERKKDDEAMVNEMVEMLQIQKVPIKVNKIVRHKARGDQKNASTVVLELENETQRNAVLFAAKKLKGMRNFEKVFLNADMTVAERARFIELKRERDLKNEKETDKKFRWAIRNDRVVRFKVMQITDESH